METNRIVQFRTLVETGNLRKAAEILNISHSGLSKSMKVLEADLGFALFQPSGRGLVVSDKGQKFYQRSARFVAAYDELLSEVSSTFTPLLRIGSFETFTSFFVGPLLRNYFPNTQIEIHELVPGRLEEALVYSKIDVGITYEPVPQKGIEYIKVASLQMGIYALKGAFSAAESSVGSDTLPFVAPVSPLEGAPSGVRGRDAWPDEKIPRNVRYRVDLLTTGLEIVRQGLAVIFIPHFVAKLHNERSGPTFRLVLMDPPRGLGSVRRDVFLVRRESTAEDKNHRQIARALRDYCLE